jgi:6-phosphogluconolactonase
MMALLTLLAASSAEFFIGTYTSPGGSEGIYRARVDLETGVISTPGLAVQTPGPSYLAIHPNGTRLYAVSEGSPGEASAFAIRADGLALLNTVRWRGGGPCHIALDPKGRFALISAYGGGTLASIRIDEIGQFGEVADVFQNAGKGPNASRQEAPHLHYAQTDGSGKQVFACDLGTDQVLRFELDPRTGRLTAQKPFAAIPGSGPRHLTLSKDGKTAYFLGELDLTVQSFAVRDGSAIQTISTVEEGTPRPGVSTAAIRLHPSGKYLYASNRGADSIACFRVVGNRLERFAVVPAGVKTPRDFNFDPSGRIMIAAGQDDGRIVSFRHDPKTGSLTPTGQSAAVSKPVCIVFRG